MECEAKLKYFRTYPIDLNMLLYNCVWNEVELLCVFLMKQLFSF